MKECQITLAITTYNSDIDRLRECIYSVLYQSYQKYNIINLDIYDDGSKAKSLKDISNLVASIKKTNTSNVEIRFFKRKKNIGIFLSRLEIMDKTKTPFMVFIDHDDSIDIDFVNELMKAKTRRFHKGFTIIAPSLFLSSQTDGYTKLPPKADLTYINDVVYGSIKLYNLRKVQSIFKEIDLKSLFKKYKIPVSVRFFSEDFIINMMIYSDAAEPPIPAPDAIYIYNYDLDGTLVSYKTNKKSVSEKDVLGYFVGIFLLFHFNESNKMYTNKVEEKIIVNYFLNYSVGLMKSDPKKFVEISKKICADRLDEKSCEKIFSVLSQFDPIKKYW